MKQPYGYPVTYIEKIGEIEKELLKVKKGGVFPLVKAPISLKGIFKGINVTAQDIKKAKDSLFHAQV
ncbi:MAG: hypothetical protein HY001_02530 [Candidatus Portnoybacteria bacterium]|nr:hypothetical protein [Candidatus Portnoybacteria bacterium]